MDPTPSSGVDSPELADSLLFSDEIQSLSFGSPPVTGSSFTALLGLGPNQAVELLHDPEPPQPPVVPSAAAAAADEEAATWQFPLPPGCTPTFPSNRALVDRAARFSVFAAEDSPEEFKLKAEPSDSGDWAAVPKLPAKRKEVREKKTKGSSAKKTKSGEENCTGGDDKLPYVHVRARRGQATDSHSLAERARREKINARMKLLQELVPGCNKISGTALVLDEIINHVQSLQRQVEFLSMRLAAVNPTGIDFTGILSSECARLMAGSPWLVADGTTDGDRQQQIWQDDMVQQQQQWGGEDADSPQQQNHVFMGQQVSSLFPNYGSTNSVSLSGQLKTEL